LNSPLIQATMGTVPTGRRVTAAPQVNSIRYVSSRAAWSAPGGKAPRTLLGLSYGRASVSGMQLTKRRAVDFCRVATAICPRSMSALAAAALPQ